jgi:hypothetical protein
VRDFVGLRITARSITRFQPQTCGTNRNIIIVLKDTTGPVLEKDREYSRTPTTSQGDTCIVVSVDGKAILSEVSIGTTSGFETLL